MSEVTAVPLRPITKGAVTALWLGISALVVWGGFAGWAMTRAPVAITQGSAAFLDYNATRLGVHTTKSGLQYQVIKKGDGPKPTMSDVALIEYRGSLPSGTVFDSTQPGHPVPIQLTRVVPGFAEALQMMPKGSVYRFWIPPSLGYGAQANGPIPADSALVFDITMHEAVSMQGMGQAQGM